MSVIQLTSIRRKILLIQSRKTWGPDGLPFGADSHKFELANRLSEQQLRGFENQHSIEFPNEYRDFLLHIGASGMGPSYGLSSLNELCAIDIKRNFATMAMPCLLSESLQPGNDKEWLIGLGGANYGDRMEQEGWNPFQGTACICHHGCGDYMLLVLNGPYRGRLFNASVDWYMPTLSPYIGFFDWYGCWLDKLLANEKASWHGF